MASTTERFAANFSFGDLAKATELKQRLWFTLAALIVYRLGSYIPVPGIDPAALEEISAQQIGGIFSVFDALAGGALGRMSIFALSIMPYISAAIIVQLLSVVSPTLAQLKREGDRGRKTINQYTRYGTVLLAAVQAYGIAIGLEAMSGADSSAVREPGPPFRLATAITLTGGTIFLMWLGEQITQRGVGNGISLIILSGIVANLPVAVASTLELGRTGAMSVGLILLLMVMAVAVITAIVFVERAQRRLLIQYPSRQPGDRMLGGTSSYLPLKLNPAGVIPPIFASSILLMPLTAAGFLTVDGPGWLATLAAVLGRGQPLFMLLYAALIVFFAFFYSAIVFDPTETADNLKKYGGFISGIRPGVQTAAYLDHVLSRLVPIGALYLVAVSLLPEVLIGRYAVPFYFGGTSLLIVVTVTMDTVAQMRSHLLAHQYESLVRKAKLKTPDARKRP